MPGMNFIPIISRGLFVFNRIALGRMPTSMGICFPAAARKSKKISRWPSGTITRSRRIVLPRVVA